VKKNKLKLGVMISGRGSNLKSLIDAMQENTFPAEIVIVIANIPDIGGIEIAEKANIPICIINHNNFGNRKLFEDEVHMALVNAKVELVCLAGFMRILTDHFVSLWLNKIINIHPSLLPSFKGLDTHNRAIQSGAKFSGCTVHFVWPEMDAGPTIIQAVVAIDQNDTAGSLASRILIEEHKIYPLAVQLIASDRVRIKNNRVKVRNSRHTNAVLINPSS
jgi:phosphoribosylglycinamide formyltransferase-1